MMVAAVAVMVVVYNKQVRQDKQEMDIPVLLVVALAQVLRLVVQQVQL